MVRPCRRVSQPKPPPSVSPATPVVELMPSGVARPCACAAASKSFSSAPAPTRAVRLAASTSTCACAERSMVRRAVGDGVAGDVMAAAAHAQQHAMRGGEAHRRLHVALVQAARDRRRTAIDGAVPDGARVFVAGVAGAQQAAADLRGERLDVGAAKLPDIAVERKVGQ